MTLHCIPMGVIREDSRNSDTIPFDLLRYLPVGRYDSTYVSLRGIASALPSPDLESPRITSSSVVANKLEPCSWWTQQLVGVFHRKKSSAWLKLILERVWCLWDVSASPLLTSHLSQHHRYWFLLLLLYQWTNTDEYICHHQPPPLHRNCPSHELWL